MINSTTGAIDVIPNQLLRKTPASTKKHLHSRGYYSSPKEDVELLTNLQSISQQHNQNIPYWFYVLTTLKCNFACPICYEKKTRENSELSLLKLNRIIKAISQFQDKHQIPSHRMNLVIFGGEPLYTTNIHVVKQILESSSKHGWKNVIVTNGSLIHNYIDIFTEHSQTISDFRITLDGPPAIHNHRRPYRDGRGTFTEVISAIDLLLEKKLSVKMQTILGSGNISHFDDLINIVKEKKWLHQKSFQWRIEGSHDYANLDPKKDEISEGKIVQKLINTWVTQPKLHGKIKFESFKYLGHIVRSFGWLGDYKTYWGPKFGFCEPQKGFHYVFSINGNIYHCPRTINNPQFYIGNIFDDTISDTELKQQTILDKPQCHSCSINTLCGGGCVVQKKYYPNLDCKNHALSVISEFIELIRDEILKIANPQKIVSINNPWPTTTSNLVSQTKP